MLVCVEPKMSSDTCEHRVAVHFDAIPETYADAYLQDRSPTAFFFERRLAIVSEFLGSLKNARILDVGCGPGIYAELCTGLGLGYHGLDLSEGMIKEGQKRFGDLPGVEFTIGSMRKLPFPSNTFDGLMCLGALEYIPKNQREPCLREMIRVVKPDGILLFSLLNESSPYWRWAEHFFPLVKFTYCNIKALVTNSPRKMLKDCSAETMPTIKFGMADSLRMLRSLGLSIVGKRYFALNLVPLPLGKKFAAQSVWLSSKMEHLLSHRIFGWLGMAFVIAAKKPEWLDF